MDKIPIVSAWADDNGAYTKKSNASRYYSFKNGNCNIVHRDPNDKYYINCRNTWAATSKPVYVHKYVELSTVYTLTRYYRYSKSNNFYNMIAKIKCMDNLLSKILFIAQQINWTWGRIVLSGTPWECNETACWCIFQEGPCSIKRSTGFVLQDSVSLDEVYVTVSKKNKAATSVSEMLNNAKVVHNVNS